MYQSTLFDGAAYFHQKRGSLVRGGPAWVLPGPHVYELSMERLRPPQQRPPQPQHPPQPLGDSEEAMDAMSALIEEADAPMQVYTYTWS